MGQEQGPDLGGLHQKYLCRYPVKTKNLVGVLYGNVSARLQENTERAVCFSILMKDRTLDLAMAKEKQ